MKNIEIRGAHIHNLKNVDVNIPKNKLTVITGVSGSGKSSLAFDTLYEEGKRRYLMFSGMSFMVDSKDSFESIKNLSPTVAVEQRIIRQSNPRSTVGTRSKISNMLAILMATNGQGMDDGDPMAMEMFQRNSPKGMCVKCLGGGIVKNINEEKLFEDKSQQIIDVCLGLGKRGRTRQMINDFCKKNGLKATDTLDTLNEEQLFGLKYGDGGKSSFMGFIPWIFQIVSGAFAAEGILEKRMIEAGLLTKGTCPKCNGTGLSEHALNVTFEGKSIYDYENMYIDDLYKHLKELDSDNPILKEILPKLECMIDTGLNHLQLSRPVPTLSGGEIQRLFLASYIIVEMDSIIFVFDEPTIGLHEIEKQNLINIIKKLVERGNTVVTVEHDPNFMSVADHIIDLGVGAGINGGKKIFEGSYQDFLECIDSRTAPYLKEMKLKKETVRSFEDCLVLENATVNNLKNVTVDIPLGVMVGVAGVSGSGKSSLISETLIPVLNNHLKQGKDTGYYSGSASLKNYELIKKCIVIDQRPIGRNKRSNPATYTGIFEEIRKLYSSTEEALELGYDAGMFSLGSKGACRLCKGEGE